MIATAAEHSNAAIKKMVSSLLSPSVCLSLPHIFLSLLVSLSTCLCVSLSHYIFLSLAHLLPYLSIPPPVSPSLSGPDEEVVESVRVVGRRRRHRKPDKRPHQRGTHPETVQQERDHPGPIPHLGILLYFYSTVLYLFSSLIYVFPVRSTLLFLYSTVLYFYSTALYSTFTSFYDTTASF